MEKVAIGINLRLGTLIKRLWFEVPDNDESKALFFSLCQKINHLDDNNEWNLFLQRVERMLGSEGFYRIAK